MELRARGQNQVNLYFVRHGEFTDLTSTSGGSDADNPLSETGIAKLQQEAETLANWRLPIDTLLSSPFRRAKQTAEIFSHVFNLPVLEEPHLARLEFGIAQLEQILNNYGTTRHLLLVGHEPDISNVVAAITGGAIQIERGGIAKISLFSLSSLKGELVWLVTPYLLGVNSDLPQS